MQQRWAKEKDYFNKILLQALDIVTAHKACKGRGRGDVITTYLRFVYSHPSRHVLQDHVQQKIEEVKAAL